MESGSSSKAKKEGNEFRISIRQTHRMEEVETFTSGTSEQKQREHLRWLMEHVSKELMAFPLQ